MKSRVSPISATAAATARDLNYRVYGKGFTRGPEDHPDHQNFDDWRAAQAGFRHGLGPKQGGILHAARATCTRKKPGSA